ncbi:gluconokinase [Neomoorella mulderi]|uniref:Xylulose kinase n=1 Tax=Moorella mulderi DSM 14980 TaxID=1122241 RepID=A0A151AZM6_9FIRM|nr:gluconokinase [Moorella mulderi]KYH33108.1 xylulose kinase [Moorella mulderi DSM 14980]
MKKTCLFIGVDLGTTTTKAVVFDLHGQIRGQAAKESGFDQPQPGWAEQDAEKIFQDTLEVIGVAVRRAGARPGEIAGVAFSSAMHGIMAVDAGGNPLTHCLIWTDNRSAPIARRLRHDQKGRELYNRCGVPLHAMVPLCKLIWMRENRPEVFKKSARFISIKEYIFFRLFGTYVIDYSLASATGLFNIYNLAWDQEALELAGINEEQLSRLVPTTYILQGLKTDYANTMSLSPDTPFIIGASDGTLANLGVGAIEEGMVAISIGTSGAVRIRVDAPCTDIKMRTFCYALTEKDWIIGGPINNAGLIYRWLRDKFFQAEAQAAQEARVEVYDLMNSYAASVPAGSDGLIFLPLLAGERAPGWNDNARGVIFGLDLHHGREHLARAVMEGVCFRLYSVALALRELSGPFKEIRATGGFTRSPLWCQILADVFGQQVTVTPGVEGACLGAAVLGMVAMGRASDINIVYQLLQERKQYHPNWPNTTKYRFLFEIYERIYKKMENEFAAMAMWHDQYQSWEG